MTTMRTPGTASASNNQNNAEQPTSSHQVINRFLISAQNIFSRLADRFDIPYGKEAVCLNEILVNNPDSNSLELFLIKLKNRGITDIQLPIPHINANPLNRSLDPRDECKLAIFLEYGADPNRNFYCLENGEKVLDIPTLLLALKHNLLACIRLLALFGARWENISRDKLIDRDKVLYDEVSEKSFDFYNQVVLKVKEINTHKKIAETEKSAGNFNEAFESYYELGMKYFEFSKTAQSESRGEVSKTTLDLFYLRKALSYFEKSLSCFKQHTNKTNLNTEIASELQKELEIFYGNVERNLALLISNPLYKDKFNIFKEEYKNLNNFLKSKIDSENNEVNYYSPTVLADESSDSDDSPEEEPLIRKRR